jgi:hypothetical protein
MQRALDVQSISEGTTDESSNASIKNLHANNRGNYEEAMVAMQAEQLNEGYGNEPLKDIDSTKEQRYICFENVILFPHGNYEIPINTFIE